MAINYNNSSIKDLKYCDSVYHNTTKIYPISSGIIEKDVKFDSIINSYHYWNEASDLDYTFEPGCYEVDAQFIYTTKTTGTGYIHYFNLVDSSNNIRNCVIKFKSENNATLTADTFYNWLKSNGYTSSDSALKLFSAGYYTYKSGTNTLTHIYASPSTNSFEFIYNNPGDPIEYISIPCSRFTFTYNQVILGAYTHFRHRLSVNIPGQTSGCVLDIYSPSLEKLTTETLYNTLLSQGYTSESNALALQNEGTTNWGTTVNSIFVDKNNANYISFVSTNASGSTSTFGYTSVDVSYSSSYYPFTTQYQGQIQDSTTYGARLINKGFTGIPNGNIAGSATLNGYLGFTIPSATILQFRTQLSPLNTKIINYAGDIDCIITKITKVADGTYPNLTNSETCEYKNCELLIS